MVSLFWEPTAEERRDVIVTVLSDLASPEVARRLMDGYPGRPISFFVQLRVLTLARTVESIVSRASVDVSRVVRDLARYQEYVRAVWANEPTLTTSLFEETQHLDTALVEADVSHLLGPRTKGGS